MTRAQARAILGAPVQAPREAPQGPTCIYRTRKGNDFITLAVQPASFSGLKRQISRPQSIEVAGRSAFCGAHGQPMLYVSARARAGAERRRAVPGREAIRDAGGGATPGLAPARPRLPSSAGLPRVPVTL